MTGYRRSFLLFTSVPKSEVTLQNSGKVGFTYVVLSPSTATADSPQPGVPLVLPSTGYIGPGREQVLTVCYLPGVLGVFCRTFQTQVGHLEPEEMALKEEGSFPRIYLDLPRRIKGNENYEQILKEAEEKLEGDSQRDEAVVAGEVTATEPPMDNSGTVLDIGLQMEMENMLLEQLALEQQKALSSFDQRARRRLLKVELPEYVLDLGHVILGDIQTHVVTITNPGQLPASSCASGRALRGTGFSVDLDRVKNLPFCKTETLEVHFDPQSANLPVGEVNVVLPIKAEEGPTFPIRLRADVAVPSLCVSRDRLEFAAVHCGQYQEETIQLHNQLQVPCKWPITVNEPVVKVRQGRPVTRNFSADLAFQYLPLQMEETTGELVLQSSELGSSYYNLHLKATASKPEKPLNFCTTLGSSHTITTKIMNYARQKTAYLLQTNSPDFQTEQTITAAAAGPRGSELSVAVTFEPCQLGETRAVLQLSSPLGSEYCTLQAVSWEFSLRGVPAQKSPGVAVLRSWALGENGACGKWLLHKMWSSVRGHYRWDSESGYLSVRSGNSISGVSPSVQHIAASIGEPVFDSIDWNVFKHHEGLLPLKNGKTCPVDFNGLVYHRQDSRWGSD
ncbi:hydrocephalus-inducing protein-like [Porphyrio hochstetteri]